MRSRRGFLKGMAGLVGAQVVHGALGSRAFGAAVASNRVRLAIVGCREGGRGNAVMHAALKVPGVEIAWVCDVDRRAREYAADDVFRRSGFRPKVAKDLRKVLEDPELDGMPTTEP